MLNRPVVFHPEGADYDVRVLGSRVRPMRDMYHALLRMSWPSALSGLAALYLVVNAAFAQGFYLLGGVANARPDSWLDAFSFSVQTFATIGYGAMYPESGAAHALMVIEALTGFMLTALGTGLIFAKFSRPTARVMFTRNIVIGPVDGQPTLTFRVGNERGNAIVDAQFRAAVIRKQQTAEGDFLYRTHDLPLVRERSLALNRSFRLAHVIDAASPFYDQNASSITEQEYELQVIIVGFDDTVMQTVHARYTYYAQDVVWNAKLADVLSTDSTGSLTLDLRKFHEIVPVDRETA